MSASGSASPPPPLYLLAELTVRNRDKLMRYAAQVQPVMARFGGRIVAVSAGRHRILEGDWPPRVLAVHRWRSEADFDTFWDSAEYAPLKELRHEACDSRIVVLPGSPEGVEEHA